MKALCLCLLLPLSLAASPTSASGLREVGRFEGIWKKCYEPGLEGVSEIDGGYLALMPDSRYYEVSASCCAGSGDPEPPYGSLGSYRTEGEVVTLAAQRVDGSAHEIPLTFRPSAKAVYFDAPRAAPVEVEALTVEGSLNYAWCRVYPGPRKR